MRILLISSEFPPGPGGIGTHAHQLALLLQRRGNEVFVLATQHHANPNDVAEFNHQQPFAVETLRDVPTPLLKAWQRYRRLRHALANFQPDVVIASGKKCVWVSGAAVRETPWVAIGHGTEFGVRSWEQQLVVSSFDRASAVVCVSDFTAGQMQSCGIRPRELRVIPNGADEQAFQVLPESEVAACRKSLGFGDDRLLLTVGHVSERKGQEVVIRALPGILRRCPNVRYLMAGLPTERPRLLKIATELGVEGRVHFLGRVPHDELLRLMNACDLFLMTSQRTKTGDVEGYGIAAIEAAFCGKTAVVSAGSGLAEAVLHDRTGLCVPEGDAAAVADAVISLLTDKAKLQRLATTARDRALNEQTWECRIGEYEDLLERVTGARSPQAMTVS